MPLTVAELMQKLPSALIPEKAAGVDATLVVVKNANHNFAPTGGPISPSREELSRMLGDFFDRVLNGAQK